MSRKILFLSLVVALLLVTFVVPASAAHHQTGQALTPGTTSRSLQLGSPLVFLPGRIQPNGDCETGGNCSLL